MRYNDPSGHCGGENDGEDCFSVAQSVIAAQGFDTIGFFDAWGEGQLENLMNTPGIDEAFFTNLLHGSWGWKSSTWHPYYLMRSEKFNAERTARIDEYNKTAASIRARNGAACRIWDCPSIMLDLASLATSVAQTGSAACAATGVGAAPCGGSAAYFTALDLAISSGALVYEGGKWVEGGTTGSNLSLKTVEFGRTAGRAAGAVPSATPVVGVFYDGVVLLYDLVIAPFVNTPGGHGSAK